MWTTSVFEVGPVLSESFRCQIGSNVNLWGINLFNERPLKVLVGPLNIMSIMSCQCHHYGKDPYRGMKPLSSPFT